MTEYLIKNARIGCVPGVDFGANGEGYLRFCFARDRAELTGAIASMRALFGVTAQPVADHTRPPSPARVLRTS
jgi:aspartate/methionine/tyrosine aminotransferase